MLVTWVPKKGVHYDDDGHNQASYQLAGVKTRATAQPGSLNRGHHIDIQGVWSRNHRRTLTVRGACSMYTYMWEH